MKKIIRCDDCGKVVQPHEYYVDYFGFISCKECESFWSSVCDSEEHEEENELFKGEDKNDN